METIEISREAFKNALARVGRRMTAYAEHVVVDGHRPGVLSGTELNGADRMWSGYRERRHDIARAVWIVTAGRVRPYYAGPHRAKVWIDGQTLAPVELRLV